MSDVVGVGVTLRVVLEKGGEAFLDAGSRDDPDRLGGLDGRLLGDRNDVVVVREDHHLFAGGHLDGEEQVGGRRVHRLTPAHDLMHAQRAEDAPNTVAGADRHHRTPHRLRVRLGFGLGAGRVPYPPFLFDLLPEVRNADASRPAGFQGRLDGGAYVVGVDVTVPQPAPAHDDDRVAQAGPHLPEGRQRLVRRFQQVHDLVAGPGRPPPPGQQPGGDREVVGASRVERPIRSGKRSAGRDVEEGVEEQDKPGAPGVHHPRGLEHGQLFGRTGQSGSGRPVGRFEDREEVRALNHRGRGGLGRGASHAQDRPLHRTLDRLVGARGGARQSVAEHGSVHSVVLLHGVRQTPEDLRQDHAGVAPRPHERAVADGLGHGRHFLGVLARPVPVPPTRRSGPCSCRCRRRERDTR